MIIKFQSYYKKSKDYSNRIIILIHSKNLYDNGTISSIEGWMYVFKPHAIIFYITKNSQLR